MTFRTRPAITVLVASAAVAMIAAGCSGTSASGPTAQSTPAASGHPQSSARTSAAPTTPAPSPSPSGTTPAPAFQASTSELTAAMRARMTGVSWHPGCPMSLSHLRLLRLTYWGFDHTAHTGELIVNASVASALTRVFASLYAARFPIRQMRVVDDFGGSDERSMTADNTSAYNCRQVYGTTSWSQHAYGLAVDINPFENPENDNGRIDPPSAVAWTDRSRTSPVMIRHGDAVWQAFRAVGWYWGGDWPSPKDYQHFSANGG